MGDELAQDHYQQFKWDIIASLDRSLPWALQEQDIRAWLERQGATLGASGRDTAGE